jgi:outer membrane protein assembly factor BamB
MIMRLPRSYRWLCFGQASLLLASGARANDWPQWRGTNRDGIWSETGVLQTFPMDGLKVRWRAPVGGGLSSPVVAQDRVFVTDAIVKEKPVAWERVQCFDEKSGKLIWTHQYEAKYFDWAFDPKSPTGPGATPIVKNGKVYTLGAAGDLFCLDVLTGAILWKRNISQEFGLAELSGCTPSPLIEGDLLILVIGGKPDAGVVALDRNSGKEVWRALSDMWTYSSPIVITAGGQRQLIVWTPQAVTSLDPATGKTWWRHPITTQGDYVIATPVARGNRLLISGLMFQLDREKPAATVLWPDTLALSRRILSRTSIPLLQEGYIYSDKSNGRLVCLEEETGKQIWETDNLTDHKAGSAIQLTANGDSALLYTNEGNLIRARLTANGYEELSRVHLIDATYFLGGRNVAWPPPTFANRHVYVRNDKELICASLAELP